MKIVTICGSSKFVDLMSVCSWLLEKYENVAVFSLHMLPEWYCKCKDHLAEKEGVFKQFDDLHIEKIKRSDEIFVVNWDYYIGDSTTNEVRTAEKLGKKIRWFTDDYIGKEVTELINNFWEENKNV